MKAHESGITTANLQTDGPTRTERINRTAAIVVTILSLTALLTVLSGFVHPPRRPETDEGSAAHIFQLSVVALVPAISFFLATADWRRPWRSARLLTFTAAVLVLAFGALYHLEHYR
jgi:hypothetical protein